MRLLTFLILMIFLMTSAYADIRINTSSNATGIVWYGDFSENTDPFPDRSKINQMSDSSLTNSVGWVSVTGRGTTPATMKLDLGSSYEIATLAVYSYHASTSETLKYITIQASDDNFTSNITLYETSARPAESSWINVTVGDSYRYLSFSNLKRQNGYPQGMISEIAVWEALGDTTPPNITVRSPSYGIYNAPVYINVTLDEAGNCDLNNSNWTIVKNTTIEFGWTGGYDGNFTLNVSCYDNVLNKASELIRFVIDDTMPSQEWINPLIDNSTSIYINDTLTLTANFTDNIGIFAFNVTIQYPSGKKRNWNESGLYSQPVFSELFIPDEEGTYLIISSVYDSHTASIIPSYNTVIDKNSLLFDFSDKYSNLQDTINITYMKDDLVNATPIKLPDRYSLSYAFSSAYAYRDFRLQCKELYFLPLSEYNAHFVCFRDKKWVDFESKSITKTTIKSCGADCYDISMLMTGKTAVFNSVGALNENTVYMSFEATEEPASFSDMLNLGRCPNTSTAEVLIYVFIFIIILIMLYISMEVLRYPIITLICCIALIFFGISLAACNPVVGILCIVMANGIGLIEVLR